MRDQAKRISRVMVPLAWLGAASVLVGGVALAGQKVPADPSVVAVSGNSASGVTQPMKLISPGTGRVVKLLPRFGPGNGFTLSPDGKFIYFEGLDGDQIAIRQIAVATRRVSFVADGAYPAVSPDSRYLAYATGSGFREVAVKDLRTGRTKVISLRRLIGQDATLLNQGTVTWLGDGSEVLAVPQPDAIPAAAGTGAFKLKGTDCGLQRSPKGLCVIAIKTSAHGLSARPMFVPWRWSRYASLISGDDSAPRSFLIARDLSSGISKITLTGTGVRGRRIASLPRSALPVAFAPDGDRILYLLGSGPPALWVATIRGGHLTRRQLLLTDSSRFGIGNVAW
jgi:hypothetical protein